MLPFDEESPEIENIDIPWTHGAYKIWWNIHRFFSNPFKEKKKELRLLEQVDVLISEGNQQKVADVCEKYISLHRIVENTKARTRLEKWITKLIVSYLSVVGLIVVVSSAKNWLITKSYPYIEIDASVLIALLTTTTVNIVTLGFIIARGLFHENEAKDIKKEKTNQDKEKKE